MTDTLDASRTKPAAVPPAALLAVRNIEVVYDDVILVLRGLSLDVPREAAAYWIPRSSAPCAQGGG